MIRVCFGEIQTNKTPADSLYFNVHKSRSGQRALPTEEEAGTAVLCSQEWLRSQHSW